MIFSVQCIKQYGYSNTRNITYGNRCTAGSMWNNYLPNPHFVESFETATGEKFNWDNYLPGYSAMKEKERVVFFYAMDCLRRKRNVWLPMGQI